MNTFERVTRGIWEYVPAELAGCADGAPSLIVILSWTGAQLRYISKYTDEYKNIFGSSSILLITTSAKDICFRSSGRRQEHLKPAVKLIAFYMDSYKSPILIPAFSEGGSSTLVELASVYLVLKGTKLPVSVLFLDSTPGCPRYLRCCNALQKALPPIPILKHVTLIVGVTVTTSMWIVFYTIKGFENNPISRTRRLNLDENAFDLRIHRCYLFSETDSLIASQDILIHEKQAREKKIPTTLVQFDGSEHCMHAKHDPIRYWNTVFIYFIIYLFIVIWRPLGHVTRNYLTVGPHLAPVTPPYP
jgi:hypothetical protein